MSVKFLEMLEKYDYSLPEKLIAQEPANPRDCARLLVYQRSAGKVCFDTFAGLDRYLPKNAVLVFNQTRVVPARLQAKKETGGKAELLYIGQEQEFIKVLADRKLNAGSKVFLSADYYFTVAKQEENIYFLKPSFPTSKIIDELNDFGETPLPPYIKHSPLTESQKREKYQSIFAKTGVSVAAPTASLHFTQRLVSRIKKQGIDIAYVRLDVNLGTFAPLREEQVQAGKLHREFYNIDKATAKKLNLAKDQGRPIIAVGTTVVRTLESASVDGDITKLSGQTDLFIREDYEFKFIDGMVTNFHVPKSSLLMLVSALTGREKLFELYAQAIKNNFRFFSFGDGMLICP